MNQTNKNPVAGFIVAFETILLFFMGILGNKISENLSIPQNILIITTGIGLGILAIISYLVTNSQQVQANTTSSLKRFLPKTMVGVFPFGVFFGVIFGSFISPLDFNSSMQILGWIASIFGYNAFYINASELAGILGGCIACLLFALIVDGYLASSLLMGFWIAFATITIIKQPSIEVNVLAVNVFITYIGQGIVFLLASILFIKFDGLFQHVRKLISEPRI
jgi:hypothetical protein